MVHLAPPGVTPLVTTERNSIKVLYDGEKGKTKFQDLKNTNKIDKRYVEFV